MSLHFREGHLDRVQVGGVFWHEQAPGPVCGEGFCGTRASVDIEVVEDHDVAGLQERGEPGLDIDVEHRAIYYPFNDPGREKSGFQADKFQGGLLLVHSLKENGPRQTRRGSVGRNDPCPCGLGKKYTKCCLQA